MIRGFSRRGQPLAVLAMVLGCWVSARAMMWDASAMPLAAPREPERVPLASAPASLPARSESGTVSLPRPAPAREAASRFVPKAARSHGIAAHKMTGKTGVLAAHRPVTYDPALAYNYPAAPAYPPGHAPALASRPRSAMQMARTFPAKFAAAESLPRARGPIVFQQPYPARSWAPGLTVQDDARLAPGISNALFPTPPGPVYAYNAPAAEAQPPRARRWSMDAWYYWRRGSTASLSQGAFAPSYGASQAGGVLRYRIAPSNGHKPTVYLRTTAALNGSGEREMALGLSARPMARVPVVVAGEARYSQTPNGNEFRPAGFAYTELPPFRLPLGMRGEVYAQGGYVGGRNATGFVDGSIRADRGLLRRGKAEVRLGGGVWGGAQKGAARMDAGPSVIVVTPLGNKVSARLAADWRFRVAGDAAPDSGPAVTLSAGF